MKKIKCGVIGVGYLGSFHADKYQALDTAELVGVCDTHPDKLTPIAEKYGTKTFDNFLDLINIVDAVSIAVPTVAHYDIAKECLCRGIHVLIEKPITSTVEQAKKLIQIAKEHDAIFQVGHLERFNAALMAIGNTLSDPQFIESHRLAPFNPRGIDVNVVLDLMIHDIDIIQSVVKSPIKSIEAHGTPVLSKFVDIANVRLLFESGCIANVTASRISFKTERKMRIFQNDAYVSIDFHQKKFAVFQKGDEEMFPGIPNIARSESTFENGDSLRLEIESFLNAISNNSTPVVTGEDGCSALETATEITRLIRDALVSRAPERFSHLAELVSFE